MILLLEACYGWFAINFNFVRIRNQDKGRPSNQTKKKQTKKKEAAVIEKPAKVFHRNRFIQMRSMSIEGMQLAGLKNYGTVLVQLMNLHSFLCDSIQSDAVI